MRGARLPFAAAFAGTVLIMASGAGAAERGTVALRLDGVPFRPEIANTPAERSRGLMHRTRAPKDGLLFVFPSDTTGGFWMKNTLVPLRILFFDTTGRRVRALRMAPCREDPCPIYDPGRRYRFALELRASDARKGVVLGPVPELRRLARLAS